MTLTFFAPIYFDAYYCRDLERFFAKNCSLGHYHEIVLEPN